MQRGDFAVQDGSIFDDDAAGVHVASETASAGDVDALAGF